MPEIQNFNYIALGTNSIRLFHCYKSTQNMLSGRLEVFTLDKCPAYYALSYCWGTANRDVPVHVNGSTLYTNLNLSNALGQLHEFTTISKESVNPVSWIWIDQICINQEDLVERSGQVHLMGAIYRQSLRTLIWLGDNFALSSKAWNLIDKIYVIFKKENPTAQTLADIPFKQVGKSLHEMHGVSTNSCLRAMQRTKINLFVRCSYCNALHLKSFTVSIVNTKYSLITHC